jgi:flagellar basal-body rod protein FlgB
MAFNDITLFAAMKAKFAWLTQRQDVLAQNIANADSPGYRARDLKSFDFKKFVRGQQNHFKMAATNPSHIDGRGRVGEFSAGEVRSPYETAPAGNSVILEEQMHKINENSATHKLISELYKKQLGLFRTALGR